MRTAALISLAGLVAAQTESLCDKYTTALLKVNNATTQYTVLTLVVNTALIGNYTQPNVGIPVTGILNPGTVNGTKVNLLPYFDGSLVSTNRGGKASAVSFLDDGGAAPLKMNKPSNGNTTSNQ
jgi:protein-disulfide isomerase